MIGLKTRYSHLQSASDGIIEMNCCVRGFNSITRPVIVVGCDTSVLDEDVQLSSAFLLEASRKSGYGGERRQIDRPKFDGLTSGSLLDV